MKAIKYILHLIYCGLYMYFMIAFAIVAFIVVLLYLYGIYELLRVIF